MGTPYCYGTSAFEPARKIQDELKLRIDFYALVKIIQICLFLASELFSLVHIYLAPYSRLWLCSHHNG